MIHQNVLEAIGNTLIRAVSAMGEAPKIRLTKCCK